MRHYTDTQGFNGWICEKRKNQLSQHSSFTHPLQAVKRCLTLFNGGKFKNLPKQASFVLGRRKLAWVTAAIVFVESLSDGAPMRFTVTGIFETRYLLTAGSPVLEQSEPFVIEADLEKGIWHIDDLRFPSRTAFTHDDLLVKFNTFEDTNKTQIEISSFKQGYPIDLESDQQLLWFVYCARDYLKNNEGKPTILPHGDPRQDIETHAYYIKTSWENQLSICPDQVEFIVDQNLLRAGISELTIEQPGPLLEERKQRLQNLIEMLPNGFVAARFKVVDWISVENTAFPKNWRLELYFKDKLMRLYQGHTEEAQAIDGIALPVVPKVTEVRDKRARDPKRAINMINYRIVDGQIPSPDRWGKIQGKASVPNGFTFPPDLERTRVIFGSIIGVMLIAPFALLIARKRNKQKTKK